jgi:hypothetical protein
MHGGRTDPHRSFPDLRLQLTDPVAAASAVRLASAPRRWISASADFSAHPPWQHRSEHPEAQRRVDAVQQRYIVVVIALTVA